MLTNRNIKVKHFLRSMLFQIRNLAPRIWLKIAIIGILLVFVFKGDTSFNYSTRNNQQVISKKDKSKKTNRAIPVRYTIYKQRLRLLEVIPHWLNKQISLLDHRVNTFSNLGFILNKGYAKKHNIAPEIVAHKLQTCNLYIKKFAPIAIEEMKEFGIPASITLAQGLLESNVGDSRLAMNSNNHFGIKCFLKDCVKGHCVNHTDDSHKDFFRQYENAAISYRDHSLFLQKERYEALFDLKTEDYEGWARGLRKAGYATDKKYADKLIKIIEYFDLNEYDQ